MFDTARRCAFGLVFVAFLVPAPASGQSGQAPAGGQAGAVRRLSVDEAVRLALEQNLSLQVQRLEPQLQDLTIAQVRTAWTPGLSSTISNASATSPISSFLSGASNSLVSDRFGLSVQASQLLPWGANYNVAWNNNRGNSNSVFDSPNPSLSSNLSASYTQPLLRNFKIDSTRQQLLISKKNREMTDVQLQETVLTIVRSVKSAYWDLTYAVENLKVQQQSLEIARESLRNNKSRVTIGTMAPIDIIEAEAEVARNEESVIVADAQITRAEDALRQLIFDPKIPDFWTTKFELTDPPVFRAQEVDVDAAVKNALEKRTDLVNMRKNLEATDINIRYFKNQILPDLNVQAGYGLAGQGGTVYTFNDSFPPVPTSVVESGYGKVLSRMFSNDFHSWSLAVTVGYPIGRSNAEAALARAKVSYSQSVLQMRSLELSVATQVREVARTLNTNRKRVDATKASRELAQRKLEAEQKKFQAGMSTSFFVVQAQRDLAAARNAELQAVLDYNRSLVDFETVQEAPVNGGSITLATASR
ncbi:MAG TPA: TolC family protein [Vicinamibacterales bacterium]